MASPKHSLRNTRHALITAYWLLITVFITSCAPKSPAPQSTPIVPTDIPIIIENGEVILLSMEENGYAHFFLYSPRWTTPPALDPGELERYRPSLSPDGNQIAFASNRSGYWDIYILTLATGETRQITDTPEYDSAPTWSPDSQWLAYETYDGNDLEIAVQSLTDPSQPPTPLTDDPAADTSPAWAPQGRKIAFVSNRSGNPEVWLADLDQTDEGRYTNLSNTLFAAERHPQWGGNRLLWVAEAQAIGVSGAHVWDANQPERPAGWIADADWAAWNSSGSSNEKLAIILNGPNQDYLSASSLDGDLLLPPRRLPGLVRGLVWLTLDLPNPPESYPRRLRQ